MYAFMVFTSDLLSFNYRFSSAFGFHIFTSMDAVTVPSFVKFVRILSHTFLLKLTTGTFITGNIFPCAAHQPLNHQ